MTYCAITDVEKRFRPILDREERNKALALIDDASAMLDAEMERFGKKFDESEKMKERLKIVCCNMVIRMLSKSNDECITNSSTTVGSFTESFTYANPDDSLYIKQKERQMLGLVKGKLFAVGV